MKGFWAYLIVAILAGSAQANGYRQVIRTVVASPVQYAPSCGVQQAPVQYAPQQQFQYVPQQQFQYAPSCGVQQRFVQQRFIQHQAAFVPGYSAGFNFNVGVGRSRFIQRRAFAPRQQRVIVRQRGVFRRR